MAFKCVLKELIWQGVFEMAAASQTLRNTGDSHNDVLTYSIPW